MSTIDNAFNSGDTPTGRFLNRAAHLMLYAIAVVAVARIPYYLGVNHWAIKVTEILAFVCIIISILHTLHTRLCVRCMEEVPADASLQAQRQGWVLWVNHSLASGRGIALYVVVAVGYIMLIGVLRLPRVAELPVDVFYLTFMYSAWLHHRLRPWCPYCRRWDDGGGIWEPSPDPVVKATR